MNTEINTSLGKIRGNDKGAYLEYLGIRYANAERFEYAVLEETLAKEGEVYDATDFGNNCPQTRGIYEHLEHPTRAFYKKEYRNNVHFKYGEDCLNLNIYAPKHASNCPVILYFYGGGFDSGCTNENSFDGAAITKRDVILVTANYRVGVLGYFTNEEVKEKYGHEGNYGLDDQFNAILWVNKYIRDFGGDPKNITIMGQSAGAISIQYLLLDKKCEGLFKNVIMMSGAGLFPRPTLPRLSENTREYWHQLMDIAGTKNLDELKALSISDLFKYIEEIRSVRKDNTFNTMPVIDGYHLTAPIDKLIKNPLPVNSIIGFTNNDMYAALMAPISKKYARKVRGYAYYFDIDAPGEDKNGAFHSCDLRYVFGTLAKSHRPYSSHDYLVSDHMIDYFTNFARTGNPNGQNLPHWDKMPGKVLHISKTSIKMGHTNGFKLFWNTITKGDPK